MSDVASLEKRIKELEERVVSLEKLTEVNSPDEEWMEALYKKARDLVIREEKASAFFLGRKLIIDFPRAKMILEKLESDGVIGPETGTGWREVLMKK